MTASTFTKSSRSLVPKSRPFHNPSTRSCTPTILLKTFLAQCQILGPNVRHLAKANNKVDLTSDPIEVLAIPMEVTLVTDAIKLMDVEANKPTEQTLRTPSVTTVNRMEAREVLREGTLNKTGRIAPPPNSGAEACCLFRFWPFPFLLGFSLLTLSNFDYFNAT